MTTPFTPVSFSCPLDPEAVPDSDEHGLFSSLDTGVNRAPEQELCIWPKVTPGVSGGAQKEPGTPDLPSLAGGRGQRAMSPSHLMLVCQPCLYLGDHHGYMHTSHIPMHLHREEPHIYP